MSRNNNLALAVRRALVLGAASTAAFVLPTHAAEEGSSTISEVVVTGSRIAQPGLTSISPVVSVGSDQIKIEGVTRVEDLINNLPQAVADFGGNLSNGSTGAATVNLRGLGSQRTLTARSVTHGAGSTVRARRSTAALRARSRILSWRSRAANLAVGSYLI